jgi:hypothetical protein
MIELPEPELRNIRRTLDTLLARADQILDIAEHELSLNFDGLAIDPGESRTSCLDFPNLLQTP